MNTQQRRSFFQAATSVVRFCSQRTFVERHFWPCGRIAVACVAVLLFFGCASLTPERISVLSAIAGQAAQIGAQEWLAKHPEHRRAFELAIISLAEVVRAGATNEVEFARRLSTLPTASLRGPDGELYITDGLVIWDAALEKAIAVEGPATQPVMRATLAGLKRAVGPKPPMPIARRTNLIAASERSGSGLGAGAATTPVSMPEPLKVPGPLQSKTNVTRSIVDVQHKPGTVPLLSVRWTAGPRSVYYIEHCDPSTNWIRFGSITNLHGAVQTNWAMPWPPSVPVGVWRVLRVR